MSFSFLSKQFLCALLIVLFVVPTTFLMQPKKADALLVEDLATEFATASNFISTKLLEIKTYVLDGLAFAVVNTLIEMLTRDILQWINSGFQGSPAFITNPQQFFLDVGDQVTGDFLKGSDLALLCSPFALQVKIALASYRGRTGRYQCTLSRVINNTENFVNGLSSTNAWNNWLQLSGDMQNNPYGAFMLGNDEITVRVAGKTAAQLKLLDWGRGFFSYPDPDCVKANEAARAANPTYGPIKGVDCPLVTPGAAIQAQVDKVLGAGQDRLNVATSFNQIVSALLTQLAKQAITGAFGLLGLSQNRYSGGRGGYTTYLAQLGTQSISPTAAANLGPSALSDISNALSSEVGINSAKSATLSQLQGAQSNLQTLQTCYETKLASSTPMLDPALQSNFQTLLSGTKATSQTLATRISNISNDLNNSNNLISQLTPIQSTLQTTPSTSSQYQSALLSYQNIRQSLSFHSSLDVQNAKNEQTQGQTDMTVLNAQTNNRIEACNNNTVVTFTNQAI